MKNNLDEFMTSKEILERTYYKEPYVIFLNDFKSFNDIYKYKTDIKNLTLVPIKSDEMHEKYHSIKLNDLLSTINFSNSNIIFADNQFPYLLPSDVAQKLIWIKEETSEDEVLEFIDNKISEYGKVIIFERPLNVKTPLIKGSFPFIRHIHFWHQK